MICPRCNFDLDTIATKREIKDIDNSIKITSEYYCYNCNSALIESCINGEHFTSDWIDFNG